VHDDGHNGARARSARIRATHDLEGTELEEMRRRTRELAALQPRPTPFARFVANLHHLLGARRRPECRPEFQDQTDVAGDIELDLQ
jgi:hypothetical protein